MEPVSTALEYKLVTATKHISFDFNPVFAVDDLEKWNTFYTTSSIYTLSTHQTSIKLTINHRESTGEYQRKQKRNIRSQAFSIYNAHALIGCLLYVIMAAAFQGHAE